ncbi:MAG: flagellar hook-associated protein FlgK [Oceanicaulis sp.]|uniref:flagellar hook-associated protein FlgK n=1 Tax=Glycocaulis sp. TaxID=1969725 RepID=UPI0025C4DF20|nr:flagellar hook-associated protein FlgK [Glycocaulis sp.]MCC5981689.1 flagellar hook-associated protein FlgK [Oceanicaulis sp.]MCH8520523.1 flagellar hook-associated protein FlgK [Glycocaulis sp.]
MALNGILGNAMSGIQASQLGMRSVSNNIANVNTPGYARTQVDLAARSAAGTGMGVQVMGITRVADVYLQAASLRAGSDASAAKAAAGILDRIQSQFGGTSDPGSLYGRLIKAFESLGAAAVDPSEQVARLSAASDLQAFFDESKRLSSEIRALRDEADRRLSAGVERVNEILTELQALNTQAQSLNASGADTTGASNRQAELLNELSGLMDIRTELQPDGRIFVRTENGVSLLDNGKLELSYVASGTGAYGADYGNISAVVSASGATVNLTSSIRSGELRALMDMRDKELPTIAAQLAEFTAGTSDALNAAHNNASAYPAPSTLTGRATGLLASDILSGSGQSVLAVVNATGELVNRIDLEFTGAGFTVNGNAGTTIGDLVNELNTALGGDGTASFTGGRLVITTSDPDNGLANLQDEDDPSSIGGRGFAHFFGLNDIITSPRPSFFDTGLTAASPLGTAAGSEMSFRITTPDGRASTNITVPADQANLGAFVAALNDPSTGMGGFGTWALDANGALNFTPNATYANYKVDLTSDSSIRAGTGLSLSQVFGIGDAARLSRSETFAVRSDLRTNSSAISFSQLNIDGASAPGDLVLTKGDGRGGQALYDALLTPRRFDSAGGFAAGTGTLQEYGARLSGDVGTRSARAERAADAAEAVKLSADQKRMDVEGVNMDEELANMILFQQAYNAAARIIQASSEMTDTLLNMVRR